jgi:hypothetical protein
MKVWCLLDGKGLLCHEVGCVVDGESPVGGRDVASLVAMCVAPSMLWLLRLVCSVTLIWIAAAFWFKTRAIVLVVDSY